MLQQSLQRYKCQAQRQLERPEGIFPADLTNCLAKSSLLWQALRALSLFASTQCLRPLRPTAFDSMNLPDLAFKTSATLLGVTTLVLGADLVHAMTKEAIFGKTPVNLCLL